MGAPQPIASSVTVDPSGTACPCLSGLPFKTCHGLAPPPRPAVIEPEARLVRLDLGAGQNPREGFEGVDLYAPEAKHKVDLWKFPWSWDDASIDELHCSHFAEHIPAREVEERDIVPLCGRVVEQTVYQAEVDKLAARWLGQDMFFAFFDECHRILKPGGTMKVIVPALQSVRAFQDPTHRRFIPRETFLYLSAEWRKLNKLDHYRVSCDFEVQVDHSYQSDLNALAPEVLQRRFAECWNVTIDFYATLKKKKG